MLRLPSALPLTREGAWWRRTLLPTLVAATWGAPAWSADLLTITQDALNHNAALSSARLVTRSTESAREAAKGALLPQVSATGSVAHSRTYESQTSGQRVSNPAFAPAAIDDNINSVSVSLEATQALFDAIATREVERAERQIDRQLYELAATEQQLLIDVASTYFEILRAYELLEARRAQERAIGRQLEQAREQFDVGLIAITEVEEAKAAYDQSRATRIAAESDLQVRFEALERLTGERYDSIKALGEAMPVKTPAPNDRQHWVELAVENNPLVLASQAGVELTRSGLALAEAQRLPSVNAFANYNYADSDADGTSGYNTDSQVGVRASLPLYTGGTTTATIQENTFLLEASQYDFEDQRRETVQQVRSRFTQVSNDVATVEARKQAIVSNQSALDATRAGYEVGTRNIVDVLNAEQSLYNAIADHASARYDYVINLLTLRQQAGTLDVAALEEVNAWLEGESVEFTLPEDSESSVTHIGQRPQREG
ncbi:TolC family outer membrane protein [Vreelandella massiliensis]|uniref:TolC family outer membrane protein n=1 Tax=Vreelandella massiliensis TaxID=1816686 RepID=UPI00096A907A|nr:TolC family outer membrane protein [Halomonas massiliensis]